MATPDLEATLKDWMGPAKAGRRLNVGPTRIRNLVKEGGLDAIRTDLGLLISPTSIERLMRERGGTDTPTNIEAEQIR
jgi:hypothetical protein